MSLNSHVEELKRKHQTLSDRVETLQRTPSASDAEIADLKKQKLKIKEQISRFETTSA
ncbi:MULTISPECIES: YdcH family protein [Lentibacter]|jgi:hypothetical protein|uniref:DUF465 domain-containing protein n=1 Tax=Lentibacter algarum TaxID=576131 RepID=A0A1H3JQA3_9RHOB|nr:MULTISPECIES: YdcH family protein [Lentibacter]MCH9823943.1 YdcH family protein [Alphaproteobacteria bacterium]MCO4778734.1 YdcH family protein [Lentibacter algarum]MDG1288848.1 YdcH family protein [Lentibacter sp.]WIF32371.1 putative small protein [Lentibacter algarum]SDY42067.1 hypothetical protein SAMN05444486_102106 [Lentibacter algarum]